MLYEKPRYRIMGDRALLVELGDEISPGINQKVRELFVGLERNLLPGVRELVPTYRSLLVIYDPLQITLPALQSQIDAMRSALDPSALPQPRRVKIPVVYGGAYGPDLEWVARYHGLTADDVIRHHTSPIYQVYMIGFTPGYPYMGEVPAAIATPRRETPRTHVPRGSVGIAQKQTGIYPVASPGGWQIIGRTPVTLYNPAGWPPTLLEMGDLVTFYAITAEELAQWPA
ncbi:MAG: 5-oxoprolinase subunit PxpB [Desulfobacterales bacterium]|nr:MAG: 5-oxoprolinase subunit PxpB [Desulfobacterales bacterium]